MSVAAETIYTPKEVAEMFGYEPAAVTAWCRSGQMRTLARSINVTEKGIGRSHFRIPETAIREFFQDFANPATPLPIPRAWKLKK